jgi:hypothetical protein
VAVALQSYMRFDLIGVAGVAGQLADKAKDAVSGGGGGGAVRPLVGDTALSCDGWVAGYTGQWCIGQCLT